MHQYAQVECLYYTFTSCFDTDKYVKWFWTQPPSADEGINRQTVASKCTGTEANQIDLNIALMEADPVKYQNSSLVLTLAYQLKDETIKKYVTLINNIQLA